MTAKSEKKQVLTNLTRDLIERLDHVAEQKTMSRSLVIRQACEEYLRRNIGEHHQEAA